MATRQGASTCAWRKSPPPVNTLAWLGLAWLGLAWLHLTFAHYTSGSSNRSATYLKRVASIECTATLPSVDRTVHCSSDAMPLSASSPPRIQRLLPTQQPLLRHNPRQHLCLPYPARSRDLPLTSAPASNRFTS